MSDLEGYGKIYESTYWGDGRDNTIDWGIVYKNLGADSTDADYQAVLDRATALGYQAPQSDQQELQNTLVTSLKSAGVWDKLDLFYVFASDGDSDFATLNWKAPSTFQISKVSSPTFTTDVGFSGNGTSSYLDTDYTPSDDGNNYTQDAASFGFFISGLGSSTSTALSDFGSPDVANRSWYRRSADRFYFNSSGFVQRTAYSANVFVHANRSTASNTQIIHNGVTKDNNTEHDSTGLPIASFTAFKRSTTFADSTLGIAFVGGDLSTEASDFYDAINTYLTAI
jgi:hypothetical protein